MQTNARPPARPPKHPSPHAYDWILDAAPGSASQRVVLRALETAPPEHMPLVGDAMADVANAGIFRAADRGHPPTSDEMAKALVTLQRTKGGKHWEPVRRAMSALLGTPVPEQVGPKEFYGLGLYEAHAFLAAVATFVG